MRSTATKIKSSQDSLREMKTTFVEGGLPLFDGAQLVRQLHESRVGRTFHGNHADKPEISIPPILMKPDILFLLLAFTLTLTPLNAQSLASSATNAAISSSIPHAEAGVFNDWLRQQNAI